MQHIYLYSDGEGMILLMLHTMTREDIILHYAMMRESCPLRARRMESIVQHSCNIGGGRCIHAHHAAT